MCNCYVLIIYNHEGIIVPDTSSTYELFFVFIWARFGNFLNIFCAVFPSAVFRPFFGHFFTIFRPILAEKNEKKPELKPVVLVGFFVGFGPPNPNPNPTKKYFWSGSNPNPNPTKISNPFHP